MSRLLFLSLLALTGAAGAADLKQVERKIAKEPAYATKSPRYLLLAIGPEARDRVWLVHDGEHLHVDRNGNGDLTEKGERVAAKKGSSGEDGYEYEVDDLTVNGKTHHDLRVRVEPLKRWMFGENANRPDARSILQADPAAVVVTLSLQVAAGHLKPKGRVLCLAGAFDLNGPLVPARKAADAPIVHAAGPLEISFWSSRPTLRHNRSCDAVTAVGTPGVGPGTFAMLCYDDTIPAATFPILEVTYPKALPGATPRRERYELKQRC